MIYKNIYWSEDQNPQDGCTEYTAYLLPVRVWHLNGQIHKEDGPAVRFPSLKIWFRHGIRHREDGPAVICPSGYQAWWVNGQFINSVGESPFPIPKFKRKEVYDFDWKKEGF